jgi:hypothetical protein
MGADFAELECPKRPPLPKPQEWATRPKAKTRCSTRRQILAAKTR